MFDSGIFDVAIGLILVYLLLSLIASVIQELIADVFTWRANNLEEGLIRLFINSNNPENADPRKSQAPDAIAARDLVNKLFDHPLIQSLTVRKTVWQTIRKKPVRPPYIPSHTFALALLNTITNVPPADGNQTLAQLRQQILQLEQDKNVPETVRKALLVLINDARIGNTTGALNNIEDWFDNMMQRVSSLYVGKIQRFLLPLGLLISVLLNADSIMIARSLWQDGLLRASVVAAAEQITREGIPRNESGTQLIEDVIGEVRELGLPFGWSQRPNDPNDITRPPRWSSILDFDLGGWTLKLLGLLATTLAISKGANFWFDLLNKIMEFRSAFRPPAQASADPILPRTPGGGDGSGNSTGGGGPATPETGGGSSATPETGGGSSGKDSSGG